MYLPVTSLMQPKFYMEIYTKPIKYFHGLEKPFTMPQKHDEP